LRGDRHIALDRQIFDYLRSRDIGSMAVRIPGTHGEAVKNNIAAMLICAGVAATTAQAQTSTPWPVRAPASSETELVPDGPTGAVR
jgi:hypothetical protein